MKSRRLSLPLACAAALVLASPAMAQSAPPLPPPGTVDAAGHVYGNADPRPEWRGGGAATAHHQAPSAHDSAAFERARADWLTECRRRQGSGKTVGGAVLGGVIGGVVGNRVAGRGNRTEGTVIGAAVGAVAGGVVGAAADRREASDYCEAYLDQYMSQHPAGYGYAQPVAYGYAPMMMMVPVAMVPVAVQSQQRECKETIVTEEWVTVSTPPRRRYIPAARPRPDKRVRVVADKRVRI
ncbi:MAG: glycine zipper 2TM domain-containing protein [Novosphingobium sp.]|uniref:glycine zipper 2TM domain-containing protein n=1 Tax=Novosphingobium sp. TaxID=1874826 RepID=UPI0032BC9386